jgi:hypothetical protein
MFDARLTLCCFDLAVAPVWKTRKLHARKSHIFPAFHRMMKGLGSAACPGTGADRHAASLLGLKRSKDAFGA